MKANGKHIVCGVVVVCVVGGACDDGPPYDEGVRQRQADCLALLVVVVAVLVVWWVGEGGLVTG